MKVCALLFCLLVDGSATECRTGRGMYELVEIETVNTAAGCKRVADDIRSGAIPLPANMRFVRRDMMPPRETPTQEARQ